MTDSVGAELLIFGMAFLVLAGALKLFRPQHVAWLQRGDHPGGPRTFAEAQLHHRRVFWMFLAAGSVALATGLFL